MGRGEDCRRRHIIKNRLFNTYILKIDIILITLKFNKSILKYEFLNNNFKSNIYYKFYLSIDLT